MRIRDGEQLLEMMRAYQVPCLLAAAVDLDLLEILAAAPRTAAEVAAATNCDVRAVAMLLDGLAAVGVVLKEDLQYSIPAELSPVSLPGTSAKRRGHVAAPGELPAALVAIAVDRALRTSRISRAEHSR